MPKAAPLGSSFTGCGKTRRCAWFWVAQRFSVCVRTSFHYECALGLAALVLLPIHSAPGCWLPSQFPGKQPSQIVGNRGQREFHCHFGLSSGAELPYSSLLLQHSKHR